MQPWYEQLLTKWPDFIVTFVGVLIGAFLGLITERLIAQWQLSTERARQERSDREHLLAHLDRVKVELRDNEQYVAKLQEDVLAHAPTANRVAQAEFFTWGAVLVDALSTAANEDLVASGLHRKLSNDLQGDLFDARQATIGLRTMVKTAERAIFFHQTVNQPDRARLTAENCRTYAQTTFETLKRVKKSAYDYANQLQKIVAKGSEKR